MNIKVNGVTLFYEKSGEGEPMILLHGNGEDHHIFDVLVKKLKADFTIYAIDSRNHGQSEKTDVYSYDTMTEDVYRFITEMKLGKVNIIGFSDGGIIGLMLAMKHGEVIRKMALLGANLKPSDFTDRSYQFIKDTYEKNKDPLFKLMLDQPNIELDDLKNVNIPTMLVGAENDIYKPETYTNLQKALPDATLKIMKGYKHDTYVVDQDILYPDFVKFFK